jgi:CheY-like chemotaxis protein
MNNYIHNVYKTLNILCVEDDLDVLETYRSLFSLIFKEVYFATNGKEGLKSFQTKDVDIVLTDYMMPELDGLQMSREIRKEDATVPIIMVTALENMTMLREAIDLHITSFLKKPFSSRTLFTTFNLAVKSVIVDRYILKEQREKIHYNDYQENLTFDKEKTITKNDIADSKRLLDFHCETFYKPKDILSGDSYLIKKINSDEYFVFLVDSMGKGISASVTAMLCSSFINYYLTKTIQQEKSFHLSILLDELLIYIRPNLLENEVICADFLHFNAKEKKVHYAIFSMPPPLYLLKNNNKLCKIKSNNTPIAPYTKEYLIESIDLEDINKMIIYSDGLNEGVIKSNNELYTLSMKKDFLEADSQKEFQKFYEEKVSQQEDDITYIFLKKET